MTADNFFIHAKKTFSDEISSINHSLNNLSKKDFNLICNHIKKLKGKLVLMGVGKSGHIAAKISSTLSSTGTPSFFINPSEASHGDLGAISKNDGILIISNSGETDEIVLILSGLIKKTKNILSITGNEESSIAKNSLIHLEAKVDKEACPNNLAPTTSTSFMLMLGDAISIALLKNNRFSPKEFAENHPGGKLGKRFLLVKDLMIDIKEIPIVKENTSILEAIKVITQFGLGFCLVKNSKQSINAIFTDGDLRRTLNKKIDIRNLSISKVMTKSFKSIEHNKNAYLAREIMSKNKIYSLVVKKHKKVIGVIRMHELNESRVF
ncbi:MAG: KpsF/GutQ family sugar-phosphate isomerase [Gammaproteobacteria bacterium]